MVSYQYSYLIGTIVLLIIWAILFFYRKDTRKEILIISFIFGFAGIIAEYIYIQDWWNPLMITNTKIGIESFLFAFFTSGIGTSIYTIIFRKKVRIKRTNKKQKLKRNTKFIILLSIFLFSFLTSFFIFKINSFYSSIISVLPILLIMWINRKDLIINSVVTGFLALLLAPIFFTVTELITPGWVESTWYLTNFSKIIILNAPLDDLIWGALMGAFVGPLYEYWQEGKLINKK